MYTIKFNAELADIIIKQYGEISDALRESCGRLTCSVNILGELKGFYAENITLEINNELELVGETIQHLYELSQKTVLFSEIFCRAEKKIRSDIDRLPVLIHGNISSRGSRADTAQNVSIPQNACVSVNENSSLCNNTVMYEDWLIGLAAENIYGG